MSTHARYWAEGPAVRDHVSPTARLRARLWGLRLDGALAAGADPASRDDLTARAAWLRHARHRAQLAAGLERVVRDADRPGWHQSAARPAHRPTIRAARGELLAIAAQLREPRQLDARGLALVRRLLIDDIGPLWTGEPDRLLPALAEIRAALSREAG